MDKREGVDKRKIWVLMLLAVSLLELLVIGSHAVMAQATATPAPTAAPGTAMPAPTATSQQPAVVPPGQNYSDFVSSLDKAPSGYTTDRVKLYYDYAFSDYLEDMPGQRTTILRSGPFWIALWAAVLIGFFFLYSVYFQNVHREKGELYGVASFAGAILERIGRIATFSLFVWALIVLTALYYIITHIIMGQVY